MIPTIIAIIIKNATILLVIFITSAESLLIAIKNSTRIAIPIGLVNKNRSNSISATKPRMFRIIYPQPCHLLVYNILTIP